MRLAARINESPRVLKLAIIIGVIIIGLLLRFPLLELPGSTYDFGYWFGWSKGIHDAGLENVYTQSPTDYVNYPPLAMYLFWFNGVIYTMLEGDWSMRTELFTIIYKLSMYLFETIAGVLIFYSARRIYKSPFVTSVLLMAAFVLNPVMVYESGYWGQYDGVVAASLIGIVILLVKEKYSWAWIIFWLTTLFKLQVIMILPLLGFITLYKLHLKKTLLIIFSTATTFFLGCGYFLIHGKGDDLIHTYRLLFSEAGGGFLEKGAFNIFYILARNNILTPSVLTTIIVRSWLFGFFLLLLVYLYRNLTRMSGVFLFTISSVIVLAFYVIPAGVHERYLIPVLPLLILATIKHSRYLYYYALLSLTLLLAMLRNETPEFLWDFDISVMQQPWFGTLFALINIGILVILSRDVLQKQPWPSLKQIKKGFQWT